MYRQARSYIIRNNIENQAYYLLLPIDFYIYNIFYTILLERYKLKTGRKNKKYLLLNIINNKEDLKIKAVLNKEALKTKSAMKPKDQIFLLNKQIK